MKQKHQDLLNILKAEAKAFSISELLKLIDFKTNKKIPERTIRRWLAELVNEGKIEIVGQYKSRQYQSCSTQNDQLGLISHPVFSDVSLKALAKIKKPIYQRQPCSYHEAWLQSYIPNETFYLSDFQRKSLQDSGQPLLGEMPAGTYARKIFNRLLIDLSYNSSRLEGNTYSILDTEKLLLEGRAAEHKLDAEKVMILNHKEAIRFLVEGVHRLVINADNIRTIHYLLSDGLVMPVEAGYIRENSVRVSGTTYMSIEGIERLTNLLNSVTEKASKIINAYEQSFFLLVHIAYLQPFIDVNKRTSRLSANIPLVKNNLIPLSFNDVSKDDYTDAVILSYELNDVSALSDLYVWSYIRSCSQYTATAEAIGIDIISVRYRQQRKDAIATIVRNKLISNKMHEFIQTMIQQNIPSEDHLKFMADLEKELNTIAPFKISGMGITQEELLAWMALRDNTALG